MAYLSPSAGLVTRDRAAVPAAGRGGVHLLRARGLLDAELGRRAPPGTARGQGQRDHVRLPHLRGSEPVHDPEHAGALPGGAAQEAAALQRQPGGWKRRDGVERRRYGRDGEDPGSDPRREGRCEGHGETGRQAGGAGGEAEASGAGAGAGALATGDEVAAAGTGFVPPCESGYPAEAGYAAGGGAASATATSLFLLERQPTEKTLQAMEKDNTNVVRTLSMGTNTIRTTFEKVEI